MIEETDTKPPSKIAAFIRAIIALGILAGAFAIAYYFISNPKHTDKKDTESVQALFVTVKEAALGSYPILIEAMGQVIPAKEITLTSQVSGEIVKTSEGFIPGGLFNAGEDIVQIDPSDYALDIKVKQAALRQANASFELEKGQQAIAKDELKIIEKTTGYALKNSDLALRKPQLEQARADISTAEANLEISQLNLSRTFLKAPFNALVSERNSNLGDIISNQATIATLVGTDEYWIDIEIPVHYLHWLNIPQNPKDSASTASVILDNNRGTRHGIIVKETGSLNAQSRLAQLILRVKDPLLLKDDAKQTSPLILGDFVRVELNGKTLENAARIPTAYIRDNQTIWLERDNKLVIQKIDVVYQDRHHAYVTKGLRNNDHIIITDIITPIEGMPLTTQKTEKATASPAPSDEKDENANATGHD